MERVLIVAGAGGVGCGLRYLLTLWLGDRFGTAIPYATLIVNVVGSFALALVIELSIHLAAFSPNVRLALTVGFLGGLTTYSTFNFETTAMLTGGHLVRGFGYLAITLLGCLGAGLAGLALARRIAG